MAWRFDSERSMIRRNLIAFVLSLCASAVITAALLMGRTPRLSDDGASVAPPGNAVPGAGELRIRFVGGEHDQWALTDPDGFLAYVRSQADIDAALLTGLLNALIVAPGRVLEVAGLFPEVRVEEDRTLEEIAAMAVAEEDVTAGLAWLEQLPAIDDRYRRIRTAVAEGWARRDPAAALSWAEALQPPEPVVIAAVIAITAEDDLEAALKMYESIAEPPPDHPAVRWAGVASLDAIARAIVSQIATNVARERMADELLRRRTARSLIALRELMTFWAGVDAVAATQWLARGADSLPPELPAGFVGELAATDAYAAAAFADGLPADMQLLVAEPIVQGLAQRDPTAAVRWIDRFQEYPGEYRNLYRAALFQAAAADPANAAAMLASAPPAIELNYIDGRGGLTGVMRLEGEVAVTWARQDLAAASTWAQGIADPAGREDAVSELADYWQRADPQGAQRWVLNLPEGEAKQGALLRLLAGAAYNGYEIEPRVAHAYALESEQQESLVNMVMSMAEYRDPRRALVLAREWIPDPEVLQQTIQRIESLEDRYSLTDTGSN